MYKILFKDQKKSNVIVRIEKYFINQPGDIILAKAVAVDDQKPQSFYIMVMYREDKTTIRLDPITDPEKTDGVKIALALMAKDPGDRKSTQPVCFKDKHPRIH